jgi:hypothetical protein
MIEPTCQQKTCSAPATCRFYWPGSGFLLACDDCAAKAVTIGRAMGCLITVHAGTSEAPRSEERPA